MQIDPTRDHKRVSAEGKQIGAMLSNVVTKAAARLALEGDPDERCKSCAFRAGTVPNGCAQTQLDALKAVMEKTPFMCHVNQCSKGKRKICYGWCAATWALKGMQPIDMSWWDYSPPDGEGPEESGTGGSNS